MGLDAGARCRCWEEGKARPFAFPDLLQFEEGELTLNVPWETNQEMYAAYDEWMRSCCAHQNMWLADERINNWAGVRSFQEALRSAGAARFASLLGEIPDGNGGSTEPDAARQCLAELEDFSSMSAFGEQIWLLDAETDERIHSFIEAYEGVFSWSKKRYLGIDREGFFVRERDGATLFRLRHFEQIRCDKARFEFRDVATGRRATSTSGIEVFAKDKPPRLPRFLKVAASADGPDEYAYIVRPLRVVFEAAVSSGNPVIWM